jgi:hypothetical protein
LKISGNVVVNNISGRIVFILKEAP